MLNFIARYKVAKAGYFFSCISLMGVILGLQGCGTPSDSPKAVGDETRDIEILENYREWNHVIRRVDAEIGAKPEPLVFGYPLIQTKGIVKAERSLFIADTGKDRNHTEQAKIWRYDLDLEELSLFYSGPLLVNSKWIYYKSKTDTEPAYLIVSDYGEENAPRTPGTGRGAKVFKIEIVNGVEAGKVTVLHEGPPFRSPEGVTVIGDDVIVADWAAGPLVSAREAEFNRGQLFKLPLSGGAPEVLFEDHDWVTLIGVCNYSIDGKLYLRLIDLDSGRHGTAYSYLAQSGTPEYFFAEVLNVSPLKLGPLERIRLTESGPIALDLKGVMKSDRVRLVLSGDAFFDNGLQSRTITREEIPADGVYTVFVDSDMSAETVDMDVLAYKQTTVISKRHISIPKNNNQTSTILDNKHAGAMNAESAVYETMGTILHTSADGTTRSVVLFPPAGGPIATVWRGEPLTQPMGVQFSDDGKYIYLTDQAAGPDGTAVLFKIPVPDKDNIRAVFPRLPFEK